jgi:hypothetical protein
LHKNNYMRNVGAYTIQRKYGCFQPEITKFVADIYYNQEHFEFDSEFTKVLNHLLAEDYTFKDHTIIYTVYNEHQEILGTLRKIRKIEHLILPIEKQFSIHADKVKPANQAGQIYEGARFAIKGGNVNILKILLKEFVFDSNKNDLLLASLDVRVLRGLRKIKWPWYDIGTPKHYLGSLTYPVAVSVHDIYGEFLYDNVHHELASKQEIFAAK